MNIEDIKIGETYNVRVQVVSKGASVFSARTLSPHGEIMDSVVFNNREAAAFSPATDEPKYDPCRKFKKGDKVKLIEWNGRTPYDTHHELKPPPGEVHIVIEDEYDRNEVYIGMSAADEHQSVVHACHLELVTPVEELEPYSVKAHQHGYHIERFDGELVATYNNDTHPDALSAVMAECKRLNEKHGKEMEK